MLAFLGVPGTDDTSKYIQPSGRGLKLEPTVSIEDVHAKSFSLDHDYDIASMSEAYAFNVNSSSGIPQEFWEDYLPSSLKDMAEGLMYCDEREINALYLYSVAITEVGYNCETVGDYNYFNYTVDAKNYQDFDSPMECFEYTAERYLNAYYDSDWQLSVPINSQDLPPVGTLNYSDDNITITEINRRYAMYDDLTVNWDWQQTVAEIMTTTSDAYLAWLNDKVEGA